MCAKMVDNITESERCLYYLYIDTKILGAVHQLISYFQSDVFDNKSCIAVYVKYYKENFEIISKMFKRKGIPYRFIKKYSDISFEDGKTVFYLFNAQSNCRMAAFRNVSHVFITHGESNKKSSVKPITRIYDHVITSGQVGIDRYLKSGIFNEFDVANGRVIRLGNTFVGQNNYSYDKNSRTLVYAPTWEGGVADENFSSITENIEELLLNIIDEQEIKELIIQIHPNLGHRDNNYKKYFTELLAKLSKQDINLRIVKNRVSLFEKIQAWHVGYKYISSSKDVKVSHAIADISAMEVQFLVKNIPTVVLAKRSLYNELVIPNRMKKYYSNALVYLDEDYEKKFFFHSPKYILPYIESYQEKSLKDLSFSRRVEWLCEYVYKNKVSQAKLLENI